MQFAHSTGWWGELVKPKFKTDQYFAVLFGWGCALMNFFGGCSRWFVSEWIATDRNLRSVLLASILSLVLFMCGSHRAMADEGGVSFWIPGFFGSLAATPQQPGFSFTSIYYHTSVSAGADVTFAREVTRGHITANFNGNLNANLSGDANLLMFAPSYVFPEQVFGGQAAVTMLVPYGTSEASADATLTGTLGPIPFTVSGGRSDSVTGFGDLVPMFSLRWNSGVNNWMTYVTGNLPVGRYDPDRLANLGIGHNALDAGGGYTYFDEKKGHEFSAVLGFTYNFENEHTDYQNGVDMHLDWGASQFLTKQIQIGLVGYLYDQISCDSGSGDRLGCFESRVVGIGPQIGYIVPMGDDLQGYLNLKGYKEFDASHRPDGWNVWLTFVISPAAKSAQPMRTTMMSTK